MNEIIEFFRGLFSTSEWPPRWKCGYWSDFHGSLYIVSELLIWTAYFLIPLIILNYLSRKKASLKFNRAYVYFAAFILLCGSTHFLDALMFWVPMYRLNALIRTATAIVSLLTVYHLVKILPQAFKQKTNIELEKEIQRREEAERKLEEANKELEAFVYIASHDLQEPLRKIKIFTTMLMDSNTNMLEEDNAIMAKISGSATRMQTMITDVLALSTIKEPGEAMEVNVNAAIDNALADLEIKIIEKAAVINVEELPSVIGNEGYLSQLFLNLIGNALKFSQVQPVINITGELIGNKARIHVTDNGIGIAEQNQHKIFDIFQRLNTKSAYEGSGIGLAICKKITEVHNGTIKVKSKPGEGTTFTIELPAAKTKTEVLNRVTT
ncbi:two-component sensor histidine kinase [Segetibacter sp. 3557_3]|uniref:sensor histidine kinase n=1 Tax=Segetibacter sp. 3557_3 TaxID=2547429 RepID=UPI00105844D0|nr:ATP-binding protein [Segetibacter sp. 3557_3]TDH23357.1 two-component sensor histidine kinase [Segetibacter sp. 3557_3]